MCLDNPDLEPIPFREPGIQGDEIKTTPEVIEEGKNLERKDFERRHANPFRQSVGKQIQ